MCSQTTCAVSDSSTNALIEIERQLRSLLPPNLYAAAWINPSPDTLMKVFEHLRTLQRILIDYVPRDVYDRPPQPGNLQHRWQDGTLLFTDLAGFTPLLEAFSTDGIEGAELLLKVINNYFSEMIEIIGKSSGNLLEFTGDALLVQFTTGDHSRDITQAINTGLRMQRAMRDFQGIPTKQGELSLKMRVGIHAGRFVKADIGTPQRMAHVLLGRAVTIAKHAEGSGAIGRVALTETVRHQLHERIQLTPSNNHHWLVVDNLSPEELGEYEITVARRRNSTPLLFDRSMSGLMSEIKSAIAMVEPLASYMPRSVLQLIVETASERRIPPAFPTIVVAFVNLLGLPESVDVALDYETDDLVACFSDAFSLINGVVELKGGILQKVTYHSIGSEMLIHFGVLNPDPGDARRAAEAMSMIRDVIESSIQPPTLHGKPIRLTYRIGITYGPVFAAEIGERRGRREFNVLGDTVNTAARIMSQASENEIWMNQSMHDQIEHDFYTLPLGEVTLKGKSSPQSVYALKEQRQD
ncbi:MAG: adenylate/guanylate cyclase domain-containing protein [Cyanobacteria bacterium P01_F01_bin.86]